MRKLLVLIWFLGLGLGGAGQTTGARSYFPEADSVGGWRTLTGTDDIRLVARLYRSGLDAAFDFVRSTSENGGLLRSEERRVGTECGCTCRSRWSPDHLKK